jgi:chorismate mutase
MEDSQLKNLRNEIDELDNQLLDILSKRTNIVRKIGEHKRLIGVAPLDQERWKKIIESHLAKAQELNLSEDFIQKLFELIHEYALKIEIEKQK